MHLTMLSRATPSASPSGPQFGREDFEVAELEREADGRWSAHLVTAAGVVAGCPECGAPAERVKEVGSQRLVHLVVVPMALTWCKRRFYCENGACDRDSWPGRRYDEGQA